ncbi:MAG TPA: ABC transporter permease, partial [Alphaproteobacteria bacterium]|nr:ABC transporter permease [Alphaproteobacteria bacterium]
EDARRAARLSFGHQGPVRETVQEGRPLHWLHTLWQDLRFGFRMLRRSPGVSVLAVLCLTLGIGANAAAFSWIEGILLRPYPAVAHQERLVAVAATKSSGARKIIGGGDGEGYTDLSWPDWQDFQRNCKLIDSFIVSRIMGTTLNRGDRAQRVTASVVSANYFDALGVHPILGRGFEPAEDFGRNAHPVVVISYWMWKEQFNLDPQIIGKTQLLNNVPHTIIGVAPEGFYGTFVGWAMALWVPASMEEVFVPGGYKLEDRGGLWIEGFARLKPGVSLEQAQQEISTVAQKLESDYLPTNRGRGVKLFPLSMTPFNQAGNLRPTLEITQAVVFLVLLIACANVSSLLLVRSLARRHEMTVRLAVGAKRSRLVKQLLTEGMILSAFGAAGGLVVAYWCRNALGPIFSPGAGAAVNLRGELDWRVFAFSTMVCVLSTLVFGLVPAVQSSKVDLAGSLKSESGTSLGSRGKSRLRSGLVLVQVALSFVLLVGAVLLLQSVQRIRTADPGFSTDNVLLAGIDLVSAGYDVQRAKTFQDALIDRVQALGGVESVAGARIPPFTYLPYFSAPIAVDGYIPEPNEQPEAEYNQVSPGYFATMGIPLVAGRDFSRSDNETALPVAIVNERMVAQYWHGLDPVGRRFMVKGQPTVVVGVAKLAKYETFGEQPKSFFYVPLRQNPSIRFYLSIRTSQAPGTVATALAREVRALDTNLAPSGFASMRQVILRTALSSQQIAVTLLTVFGGLALLLSAIGLYGVMSYSVSQGSRQLALRMALGANARDVVQLVMSHGMALTAGGVVLGVLAALALARLITNLLYTVSPYNPLAFGTAFLVMTIAALAACFLPAWRATRIDPVRALRD